MSAGLKEPAAKWRRIAHIYNEPRRHYHNLSHIESVFDRAHVILSNTKPCPVNALYLAITYHDIVYEPGASYNEMGSAAYAAADLGANEEHPNWTLIGEVMRLIRLTEYHETDDLDLIGQILIDADLHSLSDEPDKYEENSIRLRKEFKRFSDTEWRVGRIFFLKKMLERDQIYYLGDVDQEIRARFNMEHELRNLEDGSFYSEHNVDRDRFDPERS